MEYCLGAEVMFDGQRCFLPRFKKDTFLGPSLLSSTTNCTSFHKPFSFTAGHGIVQCGLKNIPSIDIRIVFGMTSTIARVN